MTDEPNTTEEVKSEAASEAVKEAAPKPKRQSKYIRTAKGKKRTAKQVSRARAYIQASLNNTIITITDQNGNTIAWASSGNCGFRGPKKATPFAASMVVNKIAEQLEPIGVKDLNVYTKGIGSGRDSAIRSLNSKGFNILSIKEITPVAHNGCRSRRPRRV